MRMTGRRGRLYTVLWLARNFSWRFLRAKGAWKWVWRGTRAIALAAVLTLVAAAIATPARALMCSWSSHRPECGWPHYCWWQQGADGRWYQLCG
jgi:hypothetical protein